MTRASTGPGLDGAGSPRVCTPGVWPLHTETPMCRVILYNYNIIIIIYVQYIQIESHNATDLYLYMSLIIPIKVTYSP